MSKEGDIYLFSIMNFRVQIPVSKEVDTYFLFLFIDAFGYADSGEQGGEHLVFCLF